MRQDINQDGKFKTAGEYSKVITLYENKTKKGGEKVNTENCKVIDIADRIKNTSTNINNNTDVKMGQVYYVTFTGKNHIQSGRRPAVVVQNNIGNQFSTNVQVIPLTTSLTKSSMPTHVELPAIECGLPQDSIAQCEMQTIVDKSELREYVTKIPSKYMGKIGSKALINTPALAFMSDNDILSLMGMIREKNGIVRVQKNITTQNPNPKRAA